LYARGEMGLAMCLRPMQSLENLSDIRS
jgi:hypothetical protein